MKTFFLNELKRDFKNSSLTIGNFDGLHLGHQRIIEVVKNEAERMKGESLLLTFSPSAAQFFKKKGWFPLLSLKEKERILESLGIDFCILAEFNSSFANLSPAFFLNEIVKKKLGAKVVVVGSDFRFGKERKGNIDLLRKEEKKYGFEVRTVKPTKVKGEIVSSSLIRKYISEARLDKASMLLGRPYSLIGSVVRGEKIGREIQFPTANLNLDYLDYIPLPPGVYVVKGMVEDRVYSGLANIGFCPTFQKSQKRVEVHLFDFKGDLYGSKMEVFFFKRLRPEIRFKNKEELRKQIEKDVEQAKKFSSQKSVVSRKSLILKSCNL